MDPQVHITKSLHQQLTDCLGEFVQAKQLKGAILNLHADKEDPLDWNGSAGNLETSTPYFLAEVSFMHLAALALKLRARGKWKLSDKLIDFLPDGRGENLLVLKEKDLSAQINIEHLLSHRSGLGPFIYHKPGKGLSWTALIHANDGMSWTLEDLLQLIRKQSAQFTPGADKKALFSHFNYLLLGLAIEQAGKNKLDNLLRDFQYRPLGLNQTYTYENPLDRTPSLFYHKETCMNMPEGMRTFGGVVSLVSTARDSMAFLRAFVHGHLFPIEYLSEMQHWIPAGNGQSYGLGLAKYAPQGLSALFSNQPPLIGMTGFTGAFALYVPEKKAYFTGTVNQMADPHLACKLVHRICKILP
jgi:D-alanyl-D-alanine carboxypeptidase